ncbi:hypothetical protein [Nostoc sp.]
MSNNDDFFKDLLGKDNSFVPTGIKKQKKNLKVNMEKFTEEGQGAFSPVKSDKNIEIKDIEETSLNSFIDD